MVESTETSDVDDDGRGLESLLEDLEDVSDDLKNLFHVWSLFVVYLLDTGVRDVEGMKLNRHLQRVVEKLNEFRDRTGFKLHMARVVAIELGVDARMYDKRLRKYLSMSEVHSKYGTTFDDEDETDAEAAAEV